MAVSGGLALTAVMLAPLSPANAAPGEPCDGLATCTETFGLTGAPEIWTVPYGITEVSMTVAAGSGGNYFSNGGAGGSVSTVLPVTPGDQLALFVGGRGAESYQGGQGGYGGGAASYGGGGYGGGGGGGSFIFTEDGGSWDLVVAAGGGGGGARDASNQGAYGGAGFGGAGGFATGTADAAGLDPANHASGATTTASGYLGGTPASFDGTTFVPGTGQTGANTGGSGSGAGGGGGYGGAGAQTPYFGGGGGSGYLAPGLPLNSTGANSGDGHIVLSYDNLGAVLTVSAASATIELGDSVDLTGTVRQFDAAGGTGYVAFWTTVDGVPTVIDAESVMTSGTGPFEGSVTRAFTPTSVGTYVITADFQSDDGLHDWVDSSNSVTIEVTEPAATPVPQTPTPPKRIETAAR